MRQYLRSLSFTPLFLLLFASTARADEHLLQPGQTLTLRIRQVIPCDGLSPAERTLNSRKTLMVGDQFLADVIHLPGGPASVVGGTVTAIQPPRWFRRPGFVEIELAQLVWRPEGHELARPVRVDLEDRGLGTRACRNLVSLLFGLAGADVGASIGAQMGQGNMAYIGGGAGIGLVVGLGCAVVQKGEAGELNPGDVFQITVGKCGYRPLPSSGPMTIHPPLNENKK